MKLEAEAEGKKKSLLGRSRRLRGHGEKLPNAIPKSPSNTRWLTNGRKSASEQVKAFEHIQLGNITVFDGGNGTTSNFLQNVVSKVAPALGILDKLPIHDTYQNIVNPSSKENAQNEPEKEEFKPVDKDGKKRPSDTPPAPDKK